MNNKGFTLIELSIVLVIIGLIVGGVLVGQDLIRAAYIRAQITQIEKFNTAVNTFYGKFQAIPGDMNNQTALQYGFSMATHNGNGSSGQGDGSGTLEGYPGVMPGISLLVGGVMNGQFSTYVSAYGETAVFWTDLSSPTGGNLIEGAFSQATEATNVSPSRTFYSQYFPEAKIGGGNYVYVIGIDGQNYFGITNIVTFAPPMIGMASMTVAQSYRIDSKVDDGIPTTGRVVALISEGGSIVWAKGGASGSKDVYVPANNSVFDGTAATAGDAAGPTTCFDAPTVGGTTNYSMEINNGAGLNCGLMFQFQ